MNIVVTVTPSAEMARLFERARNLPAETLQAVGKGLAAAGPLIVGNAVKERFTSQRGPFPVDQHKLGATVEKPRLRNTITNTPPQIHADRQEVTMGFGSNVRYFALHEFGFKGAVNVRAHKRRNGQSVRSHTRQANIPARAPMTTELRTARTTSIVLDQVTRRMKLLLDTPA